MNLSRVLQHGHKHIRISLHHSQPCSSIRIYVKPARENRKSGTALPHPNNNRPEAALLRRQSIHQESSCKEAPLDRCKRTRPSRTIPVLPNVIPSTVMPVTASGLEHRYGMPCNELRQVPRFQGTGPRRHGNSTDCMTNGTWHSSFGRSSRSLCPEVKIRSRIGPADFGPCVT